METSSMTWERLEITRHFSSTAHRDNEIWLRGEKGKCPSVMCISGNLCNKANFKVGDSIWLYKQGNTFMIKKESSDFKLRATGRSTGTLCLSSIDFIAHLNPHQNGNLYDAWVENDGIIFKPKGE